MRVQIFAVLAFAALDALAQDTPHASAGATARMARVRDGGVEKIFFGWPGRPGVAGRTTTASRVRCS